MSAEDVISSLLSSKIPLETRQGILIDVSIRLSDSNLSPSTRSSLARLLLAELNATHEGASSRSPRETLASVVEYVARTIRDADRDLTKLHDSVSLSRQHRDLEHVLISQCAFSLAAAVGNETSSDHLTSTYPRQVRLANEVVDQECVKGSVSSDVFSRSRDCATLTASESISFLRALALHGVSLSRSFFQICELLQILMLSTRNDLFQPSRNTLLLLLTQTLNDNAIDGFPKALEETRACLWQTVCSLSLRSTDSRRRTAGYNVWSRLLTTPALAPPNCALHGDQYWHMIWDALAQGTSEHRKYALAILRGSLTLLDSDVTTALMTHRVKLADRSNAQYAKFAALFETIVLNKYLNQVQDSLPDLTQMSRAGSGLCRSWIVALLYASLSHDMQDSIRRVIGGWVLEHGIELVQASPACLIPFLEGAFLPWAMLGFHYTSSVRIQKHANTICEHGEQVSAFLVEAIKVSSKPLDAINSILAYLAAQGGRMFSFARAYALDAVKHGTETGRIRLDNRGQNLLIKVAGVQGFQAMVQDLMSLRCAEIATAGIPTGASDPNFESIRKSAALVYDPPNIVGSDTSSLELTRTMTANIKSTPKNNEFLRSNKTTYRSIPQFADLLRVTQCQCLWTSGLEAGAVHVERLLDNTDTGDVSEEDIITVIGALWEECEAQDYPRSSVRRMPSLILHPVVIKLCDAHSELGALISRLSLDMQRLAENRIYVFTPLASALRRVCLEVRQAKNLPIIEFMLRYADHPPAARVEFELEKAMEAELVARIPSRTYDSYYGKDASYGHACIFDMLNRLPNVPDWSVICNVIFRDILQKWVEQKQPVPVFSRWKTTAQLQVMLLCIERALPLISDEELDTYLDKLFQVLGWEPLPRLRYLLEWIIFRFYVRYPEMRGDLLQQQRELSLDNPKYLVSFMKLTSALARLPDSTEAFALELMTQLISLAASPKIVVRHEAQWIFTPLFTCANERQWASLTTNPAFERMDDTIRRLPTYKTPPLARLLERFEPVEDHSMTHLIAGDYLRIDPGEVARLQQQDLLDVVADDESMTNGDKEVLIPVGKPQAQEVGTANPVEQARDEPLAENSTSAPLQIKSSTWSDDLLAGLPNITGQKQRRTRSIILVASFIDNAFNIGGLSRLGEIFGVESLQVQNLRVLKNKDFTSVAVASHLWFDIEQLEDDKVAQFMSERKLDGYKVIGIEQTDSSKTLGTDECALPKKVVLVLGSEREGIPARILADLDMCVEIKQMGVTRSMNVQTAASVVLYEYSRQHPS